MNETARAFEYDPADERDAIDVLEGRGYVRSDRLVGSLDGADEIYELVFDRHTVRVWVGEGVRVVVLTDNEVHEFEMRFDEGTPNAAIESAIDVAEQYATE